MKGTLGSSRDRPTLKGRQAGMPAGSRSQDHVWRQCSGSASVLWSPGKATLKRKVRGQARESHQWVRIGLRIKEAGDGALTSHHGAPKAGGSRPPCCPSPPQLFATKGPISSLASTLCGRGDKTTYFTQKC